MVWSILIRAVQSQNGIMYCVVTKNQFHNLRVTMYMSIHMIMMASCSVLSKMYLDLHFLKWTKLTMFGYWHQGLLELMTNNQLLKRWFPDCMEGYIRSTCFLTEMISTTSISLSALRNTYRKHLEYHYNSVP